MSGLLLGTGLGVGLIAMAPAMAAASTPAVPIPAPASPETPAAAPPPAAPAPPTISPPAAAAPVPTPLITPPPVPAGPILSPLARSPRWQELTKYAGVLTRVEFESAIQEIYGDGSTFPVPWRLEADSLVVETTPGSPPVVIPFRPATVKARTVERYWRTPQELRPLEPRSPVLTGVHIALDPGHIGGGYARLEERWLSFGPGEEVMEGRLVLQVAHILKPRLEALGARVTMVRDSENPVTKETPATLKPEALKVLNNAGITAPQETYTDPKADAKVLTVQWQSEKLFYRVSEIRARAQRVNEELRPDLVLCLHLNAEAWGDPQNPAFVDRNHLHLLINGCYSPEELQHEDVRFEMLQRLFSRAEQQEKALAGPVATAMAKSTGLPPYTYITKNARRVSSNPYVYARNLLANRMYACPVLYFEPYVMNHEETYRRLLLGHYQGRTLLGGRLVTSPLEDYVRGVVQGLVDYYTQARKGGA